MIRTRILETLKLSLDKSISIHLQDNPGVIGLSYGLSFQGVGKFSSSFGFADLETRRVLTIRDQLRVGSVTKLFTLLMLLKAVSLAKVTFSTTLNEIFPQTFKDKTGNLTLLHLVTHTAGLPRDVESIYWQQFPTSEELLNVIVRIDPVFFQNQKYKYSNIGYYIVGLALERIFKKTYPEILNDLVLEPLALTRTSLKPMPGSANGYSIGQDNTIIKQMPLELKGLAPAGQLYSSAEDLTSFLDILLTNDDAFVPHLLKHELFLPRHFGLTPDSFTAMGTRCLTIENRRVYFLSGHLPGFCSTVCLVPDLGLSFNMMTNSDTLLFSLAKAIIRSILPLVEKHFRCIKDMNASQPSWAHLLEYRGLYQDQFDGSRFQLAVLSNRLGVVDSALPGLFDEATLCPIDKVDHFLIVGGPYDGEVAFFERNSDRSIKILRYASSQCQRVS